MKYIVYIINALKARYSTPVEIDTRDNFVSYYWVVVFANGVRIPYPICNQEGADSSPYEYGSIQRSWIECLCIIIQSYLLRRHYDAVQCLADPFFLNSAL
jgi:hypothetical protein